MTSGFLENSLAHPLQFINLCVAFGNFSKQQNVVLVLLQYVPHKTTELISLSLTLNMSLNCTIATQHMQLKWNSFYPPNNEKKKTTSLTLTFISHHTLIHRHPWHLSQQKLKWKIAVNLASMLAGGLTWHILTFK